jgi:hypothetical protein
MGIYVTVTSEECSHIVRRETNVSEENISSNFRVEEQTK